VPVNEAGARVHVNTRGPERPATTAPDATEPAVLFLCTHYAGRSQIAMGFFKHLAGNRATPYSGGSEPAEEVNPAAIAVMSEKGINIAATMSKPPATMPTHANASFRRLVRCWEFFGSSAVMPESSAGGNGYFRPPQRV
jgi:hypothetical protein